MKLNDTTKTLGTIIAIMLIPLVIIGWNYYTKNNSTNKTNNDELNVPEIESSSQNNTDVKEDKVTESSINQNNETKQTEPKSQENNNSKTDNPSAIGGVKNLPNTSRNPVPDE